MNNYKNLTKEQLIEIAEGLDKRVSELAEEVKAYEKFKDELEYSIEEKNREIEMYLNVIDRNIAKNKTENNSTDIKTDFRVSKLEDEVKEIRGDLDKVTKTANSTWNTLKDFLSRIYK